MSKVDIVAVRRPGFLACVSCGAEVTGGTIFEVKLDGQTEWLMCPACAAAGPEVAAERMRKRAAGFTALAERLTEVVEELTAVDWPSREEVERLRGKTESRAYTGVPLFNGTIH